MKRATASLTFRRRIGVLFVLILLSFLVLVLRLAYIIFWWYPYHEYKRNPPPPADSGIVYTVKNGDYLFAISKRFQVPLKSVIRLNDIKNPDLIHPGDKIRIPEPLPAYPNEEIIVALESPANFWKGVKTVWGKTRCRFAIFGVKKDGKEILCGNCTYGTREEAEKKLPLFRLIFEVRGYQLEIRPFDIRENLSTFKHIMQ